MGIVCEDALVIKEAEKPGDRTVITVNCPDKTGLGCDLCRVILLFGLSIARGDVSKDGKWCYLVFWVFGNKTTDWDLLKRRLLEVCPSCPPAASEIYYYKPEFQQPKPPDIYLLKFWCRYDRQGLLHDVTEALCKLEHTINRVKVTTAPDGRVMDLFFITDTREQLHTKRRQKETIDFLENVLVDTMVSCEIELAIPEAIACLPSLIPPAVAEVMFNLDLPEKRACIPNTSNKVSVTLDNSFSPSHLSVRLTLLFKSSVEITRVSSMIP